MMSRFSSARFSSSVVPPFFSRLHSSRFIKPLVTFTDVACVTRGFAGIGIGGLTGLGYSTISGDSRLSRGDNIFLGMIVGSVVGICLPIVPVVVGGVVVVSKFEKNGL
jgi:hypothetical protein